MVSEMGNCAFCKIVAKQVSAEIYYEDEDVMVFKDIRPAAKFHFLTIPKKHIETVNNLKTAADKALVENLVEIGKKVLEEKGGDLENVLIGFHIPPFNSVKHLHLHIISPTSDLSIVSKVMFKPNTWWFSTADQLIKKIEDRIATGKSKF